MRTEEEIRARMALNADVLKGLEEHEFENSTFALIASIDCKAALRGFLNACEWVLNDKGEK